MNVRRRLPVRTRLTVYVGLVAVLLFTVMAGLLTVAIHRLATAHLTEEIIGVGSRVGVEVQQGYLPDPITHNQIRAIQVIDPQGRIVAASEDMRGRPIMARLSFPDGKNVTTSVVCDGFLGHGECALVAGQQVYRSGGTWTILTAARVVPPLVHPLLALVMIGFVVSFSVAITYGTYRVVTAALAPVEAIRTDLDAINVMRPDRRVPVHPNRDEIHELAKSVNRTLDRLQATMEQQRRFASDASHDLRTPIAAIRAEVEDALMAPEQADWVATSSAVLRGLDRLQALVSDLLTLTRLDAGMPEVPARVDLAELVRTEMRARQHLSKKLDCELEDGAVVAADRLGMARLLANLVDNAERHADTAITITVSRELDTEGDRRGDAVLEVLDDGAGIDPDKRELVFQRFARLDAARSRDAGGTGLGLPIARQIAEMACGTLTIHDSPRGARFVLRLPLVPMVADESVTAARDGEPR